MFRPCPKVIARPDVKHKTHTQRKFTYSNVSVTSRPSFILFFLWLDSPSGPRAPHCWGFEITCRLTTLERTPLDDWSARRRDLYLTTHNTHKRKTSMPPSGIRTRDRLQTPNIRPHGHRDRLLYIVSVHTFSLYKACLTLRRLMSYIYIYIWSTHSWCF